MGARDVRRIVAVFCILAIVPFVSGCGLVFGGTRQVIRATSSPDGASVTMSPGTSDYKTPASMSLERKNNYSLTFSAPGYTAQKFEIQHDVRVGIVVADVLLTGLIGVVVDAATGAWYKLSPEVASVTLTKATADAPGPGEIHVGISLENDKDNANVRVMSDAPGVSIHVQQR